MTELALVMPMAGRGSRFSAQGMTMPKPLIDLAGRPFFWWAIESIRRRVKVRELVFVVLREHILEHDIEKKILALYPEARVIAISDVTGGAAETAEIGISSINFSGPVAVNDCDHAFVCPGIESLVGKLAEGEASGALVGFASQNPAYSYVRFVDGFPGQVAGTVEKQCVSSYAIDGCYFFRNKNVFRDAWLKYRDECPYTELFISGLYNVLCSKGEKVIFEPLAHHFSFGTPEEFSTVDATTLKALANGEIAW